MIVLAMFGFFLVMLFFSVPVAFGLAISAAAGLLILDAPLMAIALRMFSGLNNYPFLAIPFFILAGNIMNTTGITRRLIGLSESMVGFLRSSLGQVNILASMFFAGVSGSDIADATAIGSTLIPVMKDKGYTSEEAAVITGTSSIIGPIIPPSVRMIIYGALTGSSIIGLFLAGVVPGILLGFSLMGITYILSLKRKKSMGNPGEARTGISIRAVARAARENLFCIPIPIIVVGGIYSGFFTVTEAGVSLVVYTLAIGFGVYRSINLKKLGELLLESAKTTALVGAIIGAATIFSYLLSVEGFASWFMTVTAPLQGDRILFLLLMTLAFFLLGCFVPITVILIIFAPFFPLLTQITGLHPLHFGLVIVVVLGIGAITPPYGTILYIVCHIADTTVIRTLPTLVPYLLVMLAVVIVILFVPAVTMFVPHLLGF